MDNVLETPAIKCDNKLDDERKKIEDKKKYNRDYMRAYRGTKTIRDPDNKKTANIMEYRKEYMRKYREKNGTYVGMKYTPVDKNMCVKCDICNVEIKKCARGGHNKSLKHIEALKINKV